MAEHPIHGLMREALHSLKELVEVNTVIGDPVELPDGEVIIPVSRVSLGFAAGGSEFGQAADRGRRSSMEEYAMDEGVGSGFPFGGGSGAGISVQPVGFLVVARDGVRMLSVDGSRGMERILDIAPRLLERLAGEARSRFGGGSGSQNGEGGGGTGAEAGEGRKAGSLRQRLAAGAVRNGHSGGEGMEAPGRSSGGGQGRQAGSYGTGRQDGLDRAGRDRGTRVVRTVEELLESAERRRRGRP
ncbi:MAG: GerW family sporulation protein [Bacillota bacterium]|nr:MAG: sporulation protein YtfJ [Bacillota bacterium]